MAFNAHELRLAFRREQRYADRLSVLYDRLPNEPAALAVLDEIGSRIDRSNEVAYGIARDLIEHLDAGGALPAAWGDG